jgi:hypothetical protein
MAHTFRVNLSDGRLTKKRQTRTQRKGKGFGDMAEPCGQDRRRREPEAPPQPETGKGECGRQEAA